MTFQISQINQRKEVLLFLAWLVVIIGFIFIVNTFFPQTVGSHLLLITLPAALTLFGLKPLTERIAGELSTVTIDAKGMTVVNQQTGASNALPFSELVKYRVLPAFRGRASLRLIAQDGKQLVVRGAVSPAFSALLKEFDAACRRYERQSGRKLTKMDMA